MTPTWQSGDGRVALKAPFPWFGGKRRVASLVWEALGDVDNYVEPFAGSLAVLLGRPGWDGTQRWTETANDADAYLSNFWRALYADPEAVAHYADWPVNETDLMARHLWLINEGRKRIERMEADKDFFDAEVAGLWVWGINSWIGAGFCAGNGCWVRAEDGQSVVKRPASGRGVNRKLPHLGNRDVGGQLRGGDALREWFCALSARLRRVRVCCGDWKRVVTDGALAFGNTVGVFLDPPYLGDVRCRDLYRVDDDSISLAVREWCLAHTDDRRLRIVLAGYHQEHADAMPPAWRCHRYSANAAYQTSAAAERGTGGNMSNRHNEALWFSPSCLDGTCCDAPLFDPPTHQEAAG